MQKDAYYFPHDSNSRHDHKLIKAELEFGPEAYSFYFKLLEIMRDQKDFMINSEDIKVVFYELRIDYEKGNIMLEYFIEINLFARKKGKIFSESFLSRMEHFLTIKEKRKEAGRLGGIAKADSIAKQNSSKTLAKPKQKSSKSLPLNKVNKVNKVNSKEISKEKFSEFVTMTQQQYSDLVKTYGEDFIKKCIEYLNNAKEAKGYTYKNDSGAIKSWVIKAVKEDEEKKKSKSGDDFMDWGDNILKESRQKESKVVGGAIECN